MRRTARKARQVNQPILSDENFISRPAARIVDPGWCLEGERQERLGFDLVKQVADDTSANMVVCPIKIPDNMCRHVARRQLAIAAVEISHERAAMGAQPEHAIEHVRFKKLRRFRRWVRRTGVGFAFRALQRLGLDCGVEQFTELGRTMRHNKIVEPHLRRLAIVAGRAIGDPHAPDIGATIREQFGKSRFSALNFWLAGNVGIVGDENFAAIPGNASSSAKSCSRPFSFHPNTPTRPRQFMPACVAAAAFFSPSVSTSSTSARGSTDATPCGR